MKRIYEAQKRNPIPKEYKVVLRLLQAIEPVNTIVQRNAIQIQLDVVEVPLEDGNYIMIDRLTNRQRYVATWHGDDNNIYFREIGSGVIRRFTADKTYCWLKMKPIPYQLLTNLPQTA